ncbi:MAG: transporter, partial [Mucilaginibacter sp.]|nr:transporter [Mucilaginibacter sp.]
MSKAIPAFKSWVPEWLIRFALLILILPGIVLFALSASNINAAAGYYGVTPNDAQYSMIILYGAMASFVVLEGRFFKNIASKEYMLVGVILQ